MNLDISPRLCSVKQTYTRTRTPRLHKADCGAQKQKKVPVVDDVPFPLYTNELPLIDREKLDVVLTDNQLPSTAALSLSVADPIPPSSSPTSFRQLSVVLTRSPRSSGGIRTKLPHRSGSDSKVIAVYIYIYIIRTKLPHRSGSDSKVIAVYIYIYIYIYIFTKNQKVWLCG